VRAGLFSAALFVGSLREAIATIRAHPLRGSLAALAMAAAVATTAVVQTGLNGLARSAREASARAFGSDAFVIAQVAAGGLSRRELADRIARNPAVTRADGRFLERMADSRVLYAATAQRQADVSAGGRTFDNAAVNGAQAALFEIRDVGIDRGRALTRDEEVAGAQVVVVGAGVADALFPAADALGQTVRIAGRGFRVVGVLASQGTGASASLDRYVWMPIGAFERVFGPPATLQIFSRATDLSQSGEAEDHARTSMRARRHLGPDAPDNFDIITPEASRSFVAAITERLGAAAPPISFMALVAAIVVVTNTTLVSVTERTREIGIRRAVGAARSNVLVETIAEATVIALVGGAIGLAGAAALLWIAAGPLGVDLSLDWLTALGSVAAAGVSGIVAGWYPARRAAALNVIGALRQE
jgi:putative ABC transport system permease protein